MSRNLTEMNKLEDYLKANGFEYQREDLDNLLPPGSWRATQKILGEDAEPVDKHQIIVFENGACSWDVICQYGSYGNDEGLLEGMGSIFEDDVEGWLTAADVIKKIEEAKE